MDTAVQPHKRAEIRFIGYTYSPTRPHNRPAPSSSAASFRAEFEEVRKASHIDTGRVLKLTQRLLERVEELEREVATMKAAKAKKHDSAPLPKALADFGVLKVQPPSPPCSITTPPHHTQRPMPHPQSQFPANPLRPKSSPSQVAWLGSYFSSCHKVNLQQTGETDPSQAASP